MACNKPHHASPPAVRMIGEFPQILSSTHRAKEGGGRARPFFSKTRPISCRMLRRKCTMEFLSVNVRSREFPSLTASIVASRNNHRRDLLFEFVSRLSSHLISTLSSYLSLSLAQIHTKVLTRKTNTCWHWTLFGLSQITLVRRQDHLNSSLSTLSSFLSHTSSPPNVSLLSSHPFFRSND